MPRSPRILALSCANATTVFSWTSKFTSQRPHSKQPIAQNRIVQLEMLQGVSLAAIQRLSTELRFRFRSSQHNHQVDTTRINSVWKSTRSYPAEFPCSKHQLNKQQPVPLTSVSQALGDSALLPAFASESHGAPHLVTFCSSQAWPRHQPSHCGL